MLQAGRPEHAERAFGAMAVLLPWAADRV